MKIYYETPEAIVYSVIPDEAIMQDEEVGGEIGIETSGVIDG